MKKVLILLAVATLPAISGCCCAQLCPCCPCNWFNRPAACPPTYAAPLVSSPCGPTYAAPYPQACPSPCATVGTVSPMAAPMMPQYMAPQGMPMSAQAQPMYYQSPMPACCGAPEPNCGYVPNCGYAEPNCGGPYMGNVSYGPMMECGGCGGGESCGGCNSCNSGCSNYDAGPGVVPPAPEKFVDPTPAAE